MRRAFLFLGNRLLAWGIWLVRRWAEIGTATATVERETPPQGLRIVLTIPGGIVDFSAQPQEAQRLVALHYFLGAMGRRRDA